VARDITEQKRVEVELVREKEFLAALNLNSRWLLLLLDAQQKIVSCNPAFEKLYGYTSAEIIGKSLYPLINIEDTLNEANDLTQQPGLRRYTAWAGADARMAAWSMWKYSACQY